MKIRCKRYDYNFENFFLQPQFDYNHMLIERLREMMKTNKKERDRAKKNERTRERETRVYASYVYVILCLCSNSRPPLQTISIF